MPRGRLGRGGLLWVGVLGVLGFVWMFMARLLKFQAQNVESDEQREEGLSRLPQILKRSYVHLSHHVSKEALLSKISQMRKDGPTKLVVVSDFDLTLTKYWVNGKHGLTSYRVVDCSLLMPEAFREEALSLRDRYAPVEHDQSLTLEERAKAMEDWTFHANELLVKYKLNRDAIPDIVAHADVQLRSGYSSLSDLLSTSHTPFLVFSAGLWDTITEIIKQQGTMSDSIPSNVHLVSNRLHFDRDGVVTGYAEPVIHSYKKGSIPEQFIDVLNSIKGRHNVVLLGDSLSDTRMTAGLERVDHVIKVGFLNHDEEELLSAFKDRFDIVLTGDPDLDVPLSILEAILN